MTTRPRPGLLVDRLCYRSDKFHMHIADKIMKIPREVPGRHWGRDAASLEMGASLIRPTLVPPGSICESTIPDRAIAIRQFIEIRDCHVGELPGRRSTGTNSRSP